MKNRNKIIRKLLKYDIKNGIIYEYKKYLIYIGLIIAFCLFLDKKIEDCTLIESKNYGFMNYIIHFYCGIAPIKKLSQNDIFHIPIEWLVIHGYLLFMIGNYPKKDYTEHGYQCLVRAEKKMYWWISKCIWIVIDISIYLSIIFGVTFVYSIISGHSCGSVNKSICKYIDNFDYVKLDNSKIVIAITVMSLLVFLFLCITEMVLSFMLNEIVAIIIMFSYVSTSVYWCKSGLFANYTILQRINYVSQIHGIVFISMCCITICIWGYLYFRQIDMIGKQKGGRM